MKNAFLIAAPSSNSGKTVITLGLIKALKEKGLNVQPFKCGPDYIDPIHHSAVAGQSSYNLDVWMSDEAHVNDVFNRKMKDADVGLVEGVMGLFDGAQKDKGSSAEIAQILGLPVILIVNAAATAYSVAPLLYGFKNFNPQVQLKAVIFNKVSGESHYRFLKEAADDAGVVSLGYVPKNDQLALESRHLGLSLTGNDDMLKVVDLASQLINQHVDLDLLLSSTKKEICKPHEVSFRDKSNLRIGVAQDEAFNFMYPANIDCIKQLGEVVYFSPLNDSVIPDCDILWFPGGYPELFAKELSDNVAMTKAIQAFEKAGGKLIAECGGMMYLGQSLELKDGQTYPMAGIFDYSSSLQNMKLKLGYRTVHVGDLPFKGHEFHYSYVDRDCNDKAQYVAKTARGTEVEMPIYRSKNTWSSYFHIYLGELSKMDAFIELILKS